MISFIYMLNPFPSLFDFSLFAPLLLRIVAGCIMIGFGKTHLRYESSWKSFFEMIGLRPAKFFVVLLGALEVIAGVMLVAGGGVQIAAIFAAVVTAAAIAIEYQNESLLRRDLVFYILLLSVFLSLIVTGAGLYALDLPL